MKKAGLAKTTAVPQWGEVLNNSFALYADKKNLPICEFLLEYYINKNWRPKDIDLYYQVLVMQYGLAEWLEESLQLDLGLMFRERPDKDIYDLFRLAQREFVPPDSQKVKPRLLSQALVIEAIGKHGPLALRSVRVNDTLADWLKDRRTSGKRINAVAEALKQYARSRKSLDPGQDPSEKLRTIGEREVVNLYRDLLKIMHLFKDRGKSAPSSELRKLFQQVIVEYYQELRKEFIKSVDQGHLNSDSYRVLFATDLTSLPTLCESITGVIFANKTLGEEFLSLRWPPNAMAKKIIARLLGVSWSKITKVIRPDAVK